MVDRKNIPTPEEFNKRMSECIEYKKLVKLKEHLKWFGNEVCSIDITKLNKMIDNRVKEIPKKSINFDTQVHGQAIQI